jgi:ATP adenylyltransferase
MLNRYPYNNGHVMIVPNRHVPMLDRLAQREKLDLLQLLDRSLAVLKKTIHPQGFNIGINLGRSAGAGFPGHLHIHIVPRWTGDTNFMPVAGETKVISDSLEAVYEALSRRLKR